MGRKAFEATVERVAKQYQEWGADSPEATARKQVAPAAEKVDRSRRFEPVSRPVPEGAEFGSVSTKEVRVEVPVGEENSWRLERAGGYAPPLVAFHQPADRKAMRELHETQERKLRERLGG